jgi:glycerol kinase
MENEPEIHAAVAAGEAFFGTVDSWLLFRLTGGAVHATDHTNASRTLLFNLRTLDWDRWLLEKWGLGGLRLPAVRPSAFAYAETDFQGLLAKPVPIAALVGDSHAAAFGEGCVVPGMGKATMGTGSSILMNVGPSRVDSTSGMVSTVCWSIPGRLDYALEGIIVSAGATVQWLKENLGLFADSRDTETLAASVPDSGGVHIVPGFSGLGAPWWRMDARGAICGLTFASTRAHVVRAALESIPFQIADILSSMAADSPVPLSELRVDGGITRNAFVMQLLADVLGTPVVNPGLPDISALGAALLAGIGSGVYGGIGQVPGHAQAEMRFIPGPGREKAKRDHAEWRRTIAKLL